MFSNRAHLFVLLEIEYFFVTRTAYIGPRRAVLKYRSADSSSRPMILLRFPFCEVFQNGISFDGFCQHD
jgi:hypothetical protein